MTIICVASANWYSRLHLIFQTLTSTWSGFVWRIEKRYARHSRQQATIAAALPFILQIQTSIKRNNFAQLEYLGRQADTFSGKLRQMDFAVELFIQRTSLKFPNDFKTMPPRENPIDFCRWTRIADLCFYCFASKCQSGLGGLRFKRRFLIQDSGRQSPTTLSTSRGLDVQSGI